MKKRLAPFLALVGSAAACATERSTVRVVDVPARPAVTPADSSRDQQAVSEAISQILDAARKKDLDRLESLHAYGPEFSKFDDDLGDRQDAAAGKAGERNALTALTTFDAAADKLKVDVFGPTAVATLLLKYDAAMGKERMAGVSRVTLVFVKDGGAWKIVHEHASPYKRAP